MKIIICVLPGAPLILSDGVHGLGRRLRELGVIAEVLAAALEQGLTPEENMAKLIKEFTPPRFAEAKADRPVPRVHPKRKAGKKGNDPHAVAKHMIPEPPRNPRRR